MKKFCNFFLILIISVIFLEVFLRISGLFYKTSIFIPEEYKNKKIIVCAGDSFTYGVGVPRGNDYPSVLERLINNSDYKVINIGEPGANTAIVKNKLEEILYRIKPEMVIIMAGVNNTWNFRDLYNEKDFLSNFIENLKIIRLYRFIKSTKKSYAAREFKDIFNMSLIETVYADENKSEKDLISYTSGSHNILQFFSQNNKKMDKSQKLELCINLLEEFDFSPDTKIFLKNRNKSVKPDIKLEMDFAQKFLSWCEINKQYLIDEFGKNIAGLYFKYSLFITDRQNKLELLLKTIDWDDNTSYIRNIPDYFTHKNIAEQYGNKILNLLLKKIDEKKIDAAILKDISLNLKKIKQQSYNIRKLKSEFELKYLDINPHDNIILKEYSAYLLSDSYSGENSLSFAVKWHSDTIIKHYIPDIVYRTAILYFRSGKTGSSIKLMEDLAETYPENGEYIVFLAYLYSDFSKERNLQKTEEMLLKAYNILNKELKKNNSSEQILSSLSTLYTIRARNDYSELNNAVKWHKEIIHNIDNAQILYNYGSLISKTGTTEKIIKEALFYIEKAIELNPYNKDFRFTAWQLYYNNLNDYEKAALYYDNKNNFPDKKMNSDESMKEAYRDMEYIAEKILEQDIDLILMNYPEIESKYMKSIAEKKGCLFIDNMQYFNSLENKKQYFFPDGHLNVKGNRMLAGNVFDSLF